MHSLGELANTTWSRLEDLLKDFDEPEQERETFLGLTRQFFEEQLSIYERKRHESECSLQNLTEDMCKLFDELQLPRMTYEDNCQMTLIEKRKCITDKINELQNLIQERDKQLIQLRQSIDIKVKLIGNIHININEITSVNQANSTLLETTNNLSKLKQDISSLVNDIHCLNSDIVSNNILLAKSFVLLNDENESSWLINHATTTGSSLYSQLVIDYNNLKDEFLHEIIQLRTELDQKEPPSPYDLKQELTNLRSRKRYLSLLSKFQHSLTAQSSLDEIRRTYDQLTASLQKQAHEKLQHLWDQLDVPSDQRIIPIHDIDESDYLATTNEVNRLELYIESIRPLLIKIQKREWYKKEMIDFEKNAADPARLRGNSTQLLKEERFRKDLAREFPKLTDDLRRMVAEWEEANQQKLIYAGESYLEIMDKEKLSVDFELLHLRLLTKCQIIAQSTTDDAIVTPRNIHSAPATSSPVRSTLIPQKSPSPMTPSSTYKTTTRIPTMSFTNSNRKINKHV